VSAKGRTKQTPAQKIAALEVDRAYWLTQRGAIADHVLSHIDTAVGMWKRVMSGDIRIGTQTEEDYTEL
jgi:phage gp36-like protein